MGFAADFTLSATNVFCARYDVSASSTAVATIPDEVADGDLLMLPCASNANPTVAFSTPSGWTLLVPQKNGSASFGGRAAIFYKVWRTGDSKTVTVSGNGGSTELRVFLIMFKANTDGASLTIGNPPSTGFGASSTYESELTVAGTSFTVRALRPDATLTDFRLVIAVISAGTGLPGFVPYKPASQDVNLFRVPLTNVDFSSIGNTVGLNVFFGLSPDPSGMDANDETWSTNGTSYKIYAVSIVVHDPAAAGASFGVDNIDPGEADGVILAVGLEHLTILTDGSGGGGGVSVF